MKRMISIAAVVLLCACLLAVPAAALTATASLEGPNTVRAGDTITLTFYINGSGVYGTEGNLSYDSTQLELTNTTQKIGNGWIVEMNGGVFVAYDNNLAKPISQKTAIFTATFKVKSNVATGATIKVSCSDVVVSDSVNGIELGTVSWSKTVAPPMSKDNSLKSLTVSNATISPSFSAETTNYTAEVPFEVSKLDIKATANDSKAKVAINNPTLTPNGTTKVTVTVTAENGSKKTYTISVKRAQDPNYVASNNNTLSDITVNGFLLSPVFSGENTQYVIWLPYETEQVTVSGRPADSKASVTVEGGENLVAGADNEIKVICTAEDGTQKVYTIIAKRAPAHGSTEPTEPAPTDPMPTDPEPTEPAPTEAKPTEPVPTEPQTPVEPEPAGGIPWWTLLLVGGVCLAVGALGVMFITGKKKG